MKDIHKHTHTHTQHTKTNFQVRGAILVSKYIYNLQVLDEWLKLEPLSNEE